MIAMERKRVEIPESIRKAKDFSQGIACPKCECRHWNVEQTRRVGGMLKRVRTCRNCGCMIESQERFSAIIETDDGSI